MPLGKVYKIVVVEDEPIIKENIIKKIALAGPAFKVAGSARNGKKALEVIEAVKPDILLTDIRMPGMDGLELIRKIKVSRPGMQIIILSGYNDFEYAREAIKSGVQEYLLKPLDTGLLKEALFGIKFKLDAANEKLEREILYSRINGTPCESELPSGFNHGSFSLFILCIGNLISQASTQKQLRCFSDIWNSVRWEAVLPPNAAWWLIDEKQPNQKCLLLSAAEKTPDLESISHRLLDFLSKLAAPLPVNVCTDDTAIPFTDIWATAQNLRALLDQRLVLGKSAVITPSSPGGAEVPPALLDQAVQNRLVSVINQKNLQLLQKELYSLFSRWETSHYPQKWVRKLLYQLLLLFQRHTLHLSEEEMLQRELELDGILASASGLSPVHGELWRIFSSLLSSSDDVRNDEMQVLVSHVEEYIKANYTSDLSIQDIARKFAFNPTYLAKVYKKYTKQTPAKHIINLRIKEAKRLMEASPELDIKEISEMVGYANQHYFSRIFKIVTGKTPSEYRESLPL